MAREHISGVPYRILGKTGIVVKVEEKRPQTAPLITYQRKRED